MTPVLSSTFSTPDCRHGFSAALRRSAVISSDPKLRHSKWSQKCTTSFRPGGLAFRGRGSRVWVLLGRSACGLGESVVRVLACASLLSLGCSKVLFGTLQARAWDLGRAEGYVSRCWVLRGLWVGAIGQSGFKTPIRLSRRGSWFEI